MKKVYQIDSNGFYVTDVILQENQKVPDDCVDVELQDGLFKPQFVGGSWVEGETQENLLSVLKTQKKAELDNKCNESIMGGFTSLALGITHTYSSIITDEIWYNATKNRFDLDSTFTEVNWKTIDSGYLPHTKAQFQQVFIDGHTWGGNQIAKLNNLKSQVDSAQSQTELDAIVW